MAGASETRTLVARITHLEMTEPPSSRTHAPFGQRLALMRADAMPVSFYRYLYEQVGKPHHWLLRRHASGEELRRILHSDATELHVLYADGAPAGFFELDLSKRPESIEILYFGLTPDFQGRGLARFFLSEAIAAAWAHMPRKLVIQTNTLDSPRALQLYQKAGFCPVGWSEEEIAVWE